jgi:hypothetical protein
VADELIAGVDFSGASKVPNDTWIALGRLAAWQFQVTEIRKVGSHALAQELNKLSCAAVGIDCPFSLPMEFVDYLAQKGLRKDFQSWQEIAEHLVFLPFDQFLSLAQEFKREPKRVTDKATIAPAQSPLHRGNPSMIQMTYQGMRLLASLDPQRFTVLPFQSENKDRCTVIEVYPRDFLKFLALPDTGYKGRTKKEEEAVQKIRRQIISGIIELRERKQISFKEMVRLSMPKDVETQALQSDHALDAVIACYLTALFVSSPSLFADPFSLDNSDVLLEGWIYSLKQSS